MATNSDPRDGTVAASRARRSYSPHWHPLLAAVELEPGCWHMQDDYARPYGVIRLLRINGEAGYRVVTWAERSEDRELIGYFRTLRAAAMAAHRRFVRSHGQTGAPNGTRPGER